MAYASTADVQTLLGSFTIPTDWTTGTPTPLSVAITRAEKLIDRATRCHFETKTLAFEIRGDGTEIMLLTPVTCWPITSVVSIVERDDYDDLWAAGDTLETDEYDIHESKRALVRFSNVWIGARFKNYKVTGNFGYVTTPLDIRKAMVLLLREEMQPGYLREYESFESERFPDGYSYTRSSGVVSQAAQRASLTGHSVVDRLLAPFVFSLPGITTTK